jgi:hypothetical protein
MSTFTLYITSFYAIILTSYWVGGLYFKLIIRKNSITENINLAIGEKILVGVTIITALIAIYKTNGITTQSIILLLLISPCLFLKKEEYPNASKPSKKITLSIFIFSFFIFCFHWFGFYHLHDHVFYAKLGKAIFTNGNESWSALYNNFRPASGIMLFHYSDIWLGEFISKLVLNNSLFSLTRIIYPIYHLIMFIVGYVIIIEKFKNIKISLLIFIAILYGSALLFFPVLTPEQGHHTFWHYGFPEVTSFKSLVIYPYLFLALYYLIRNDFEVFIFLICVTCLEYFTLFIALFPTTNFIILLYFGLKKHKLLKTIINLILFNLPLVLMLILPIIFKDTVTSNSSFSNIRHVILPFNSYITNWYSNLKLFFNYFLRPFYLYPLTTLFMFYYSIKMKKTLLFILLNFIFSSIFIVLFYNLTNANQAISIIIGPLMLFATIELFTFLDKKIAIITSTSLLIISFLNLEEINSLNLGNYKMNVFESKLMNFAKLNLKKENWCYYSEKPWSTWMYSSQISNSTILLENDTYLGLEIAPFFRSDFETYSKKNPDSPICSLKQDVNIFLKLLKSHKIKYVYVENINSVNNNFKSFLKPILTENQKGIFKLEYNKKRI